MKIEEIAEKDSLTKAIPSASHPLGAIVCRKPSRKLWMAIYARHSSKLSIESLKK